MILAVSLMLSVIADIGLYAMGAFLGQSVISLYIRGLLFHINRAYR